MEGLKNLSKGLGSSVCAASAATGTAGDAALAVLVFTCAWVVVKANKCASNIGNTYFVIVLYLVK